MKRLWICIVLLLKRMLRRPSMWFLFGCMLLFGFVTMQVSSSGTTVSVALYCESPDATGKTILETLTQRKGFYDYYTVDSLDRLRADVQSGTAECGYAFPNDLAALLENPKAGDKIIVYVSSSTVLASVLNESIYSALFDEDAPRILSDYLANSDQVSFSEEEASSLVSQAFEKNQNDQSLFTIQTNEAAQPVRGYQFPLRGLFSVILFTAALSGIADYRKDEKQGCYSRLSALPKGSICLLYATVPALCFGIVSLVCLAFCGLLEAPGTELLALLVYLILISAVSALLSAAIRSDSIFYGLFPLLILGCLIGSPIFISLSDLTPLGTVLEKCFPPTYYLSFF